MDRAVAAVLAEQSYRERLPRPELAGLLSCAWILRVSPQAGAYEHRTVPNGCAELASSLESGIVRVTGPRRTALLGTVSPGATVVGLRLHPGVAPPVLASALELLDLELDLDAVWGRSALRLGARLTEAASGEAALRILEREVLARVVDAPQPDPLVTEAVRRLQPCQHTDPVGATAGLFISPRQLRRRLAAALGFGPKTLQRILRFQGFLALSTTRPQVPMTLARLATLAGYADQAHLTRECVRLTGLTPSLFHEEMRRSCGENHDHAASFASLRAALLRRAQP